MSFCCRLPAIIAGQRSVSSRSNCRLAERSARPHMAPARPSNLKKDLTTKIDALDIFQPRLATRQARGSSMWGVPVRRTDRAALHMLAYTPVSLCFLAPLARIIHGGVDFLEVSGD